jgi:hypothetical protein
MDLREIGREDVDLIHLAQDRDQWRTIVNRGSIKGAEFLGQMSDYKILKKDSVPCS